MKKEIKRETVCSKHLQQFREVVECYDCTIYPQENINEQIKLATLAERERVIKLIDDGYEKNNWCICDGKSYPLKSGRHSTECSMADVIPERIMAAITLNPQDDE